MGSPRRRSGLPCQPSGRVPHVDAIQREPFRSALPAAPCRPNKHEATASLVWPVDNPCLAIKSALWNATGHEVNERLEGAAAASRSLDDAWLFPVTR